MIKVLIVDDSAVVRKILTAELGHDPDIEVIGTASDAYVARDKIVTLKPDVVTLDIELPGMDGITFLKKIMHYHPMPVIVVSSLTEKAGSLAMEALQAGAIDVLCKPGPSYTVGDMAVDLISKIKAAAKVRIREKNREAQEIKPATLAMNKTTEKIVVMGASTGGTEAIRDILIQYTEDIPAILITQHMPEKFTTSFAEHLNNECRPEIKEAQNGDKASPGKVFIAPGNRHMLLKRMGRDYYIEIKDGPRVNRHRPSVDVLFSSAALYAGANAVGVLLTGMGKDGAEGLLNMKKAGALTVAQDEKSSVVFGMPKAAIDLGAADYVAPPSDIAGIILELCRKNGKQEEI